MPSGMRLEKPFPRMVSSPSEGEFKEKPQLDVEGTMSRAQAVSRQEGSALGQELVQCTIT